MNKFKVFLFLIGMFPLSGHCVLTTYDPTTVIEVGKVLQETKKQVEQLKNVKKELEQTKSILGNFTGDAQSLKNSLLSWETYYDKIDYLDADSFSAFKWLGVDKLHPENYASDIFGYASSFNSKQALEDVKHQILDDEKYPEEMQYRRQELAHNSMASSIVVSNESKNNIAGAKKKLTDAMTKSIGASDLLNTLKAQNELLSVIASEAIQQREIQAQQLEMLASFFVRFEGSSKLTEPAKRGTTKKPWE
jgi:conjugal transfer/entry exclusion protein